MVDYSFINLGIMAGHRSTTIRLLTIYCVKDYLFLNLVLLQVTEAPQYGYLVLTTYLSYDRLFLNIVLLQVTEAPLYGHQVPTNYL